MYIPKSFAETDQNLLHDFIEKHSFATVVTNDGDEPVASHLPLLLDRDRGTRGTLIGHMARSNSQWQHAAGQSVLAVFHGPHAYISPSWIAAENVVPTWNYVAVHAYGTFQIEESSQRRLEIVRDYVEHYESSMESPWSLDESDGDFIDRLLEAIVGFTIEIQRIEGKWKLNQNHDLQRRTEIIRGLRNTGGENRDQIADLMSNTLEHA